MMAVLVAVLHFALAGLASAQHTFTNDDVPYLGAGSPFSSMTVFQSGAQCCGSPISTGSYGAGDTILFIPPRVALAEKTTCAYVADAGGTGGHGPGDIAVFRYTSGTYHLVQNRTSGVGGNGYPYGIGLKVDQSHQLLFANWAGNSSDIVESFKINSGTCKLTSTTHSANGLGLNHGYMEGWDLNGTVIEAAYQDGSVGYYSYTPGGAITPPTQGNANCFTVYGAYPADVHITSDNYAVFDCLQPAATGALIDTAPVSSVLTTTQCSGAPCGTSSGTPIMLSVAEVLYPAPPAPTQYVFVIGGASGSVQTLDYTLGGTVTLATCFSPFMAGQFTAAGYTIPGNGGIISIGTHDRLMVALEGETVDTTKSLVQAYTIPASGCLTSPDPQLTDPNSPYVSSIATYPQ